MIYEQFFSDDDIMNLALLLTCKQVHNEASIMAFAATTFEVKAKTYPLESYHRDSYMKHDWRVVSDAGAWKLKASALAKVKAAAITDVIIPCITDSPILHSSLYYIPKAIQDGGVRPCRFYSHSDQLDKTWLHAEPMMQPREYYDIFNYDLVSTTLSIIELFAQNPQLRALVFRVTRNGSLAAAHTDYRFARVSGHSSEANTTSANSGASGYYETEIWYPNLESGDQDHFALKHWKAGLLVHCTEKDA